MITNSTRRLVKRPHKLNNDYEDMREYAESLESMLRSTVEQLKHVEDLRVKDCGPIPATLTAGVIRDAEYILSNVSREQSQPGTRSATQ